MFKSKLIATALIVSASISTAFAQSSKEYVVKMDSHLATTMEQAQKAVGSVKGANVQVLKKLGMEGYWLVKVTTESESRQNYGVSSLVSKPGVLNIEENIIYRRNAAIPNDAQFANQRRYFNPQGVNGGVYATQNWLAAWDITSGSAESRVAVLDGGILPIRDLAGKILPGIDTIFNTGSSRDNDGRDFNAVDSGDWVSPEIQCGPSENSSWHGTKVASSIAGIAYNGVGVAGFAPNVRIVPIRALGACGGTLADVVDGMLWSAGEQITDRNGRNMARISQPVQVINLSIGAQAGCTSGIMADAVNLITSKGIAVVAAAGNTGLGAVENPANCSGAIAVGSVNDMGQKSSFSNFGGSFVVSAIGQSIQTVGDSGTTTATGTEVADASTGTSFSTPAVSALVAMMKGVNPAISLNNIRQILDNTAKPFGTGVNNCPATSTQPITCICTDDTCSRGIIDAQAALQATRATLPVAHSGYSKRVPTGVQTLDGSASSAPSGATIASVNWTQISGPVTESITPVNATNAQVNLTGTGVYVFRARVTDSVGRTSDSFVTYSTANTTVPVMGSITDPTTPTTPTEPNPPAASGGGGGGGGKLGLLAMGILMLVGAAVQRLKNSQ